MDLREFHGKLKSFGIGLLVVVLSPVWIPIFFVCAIVAGVVKFLVNIGEELTGGGDR